MAAHFTAASGSRIELREGVMVAVAVQRPCFRLTVRHSGGEEAVATSERMESLIELNEQMRALDYQLVRLEPLK